MNKRIFFTTVFILGSIAFCIFVILTLYIQHKESQVQSRPVPFVSAAKILLKKSARNIKDRVYYEATIHNPEGDTLPDWIDDMILGKIRDIL